MIPDWVAAYKAHDRAALTSRARDLDKVRYAAKLERQRMRHERASTLWMLYGIAGTAVAMLMLVNSIRNGDLSTWSGYYSTILDFISAGFALVNIVVTRNAHKKWRDQRWRINDLDAQIRTLTDQIGLVADALKNLHRH